MSDRTNNGPPPANSINLHSIMVDLWQNLLGILLISISCGMLVHMILCYRYVPTYTTTATMVVTNTGVDNNVYNNLYAASATAKKFSRLINSKAMQRIVVKEIGLNEFQGTANATSVDNANLIEMTVTASSPEICFKEARAILDNYSLVSEDLMGGINLTVLKAPQVPTVASNPLSTYRRVVQAVLAAFMAMMVFVSLMSSIKDTIRTTRDAETKLDTKTLATVHYEQKYHSLSLWIKHLRDKTSILITDPVTSFLYTETIRKLTSRIQTGMQEKDARSLLITSVLENEGKSTIAANIALAMAEEGKKVLLIDGDFRKPSLHKVLNMKDKEFTSLRDFLKNKSVEEDFENLITEVPGTNLKCILNRTDAPETMEMFSVDTIFRLFDYYRKRMDYLIIDSPPMQLVADAEEMSHLCETNLLVVRQHMVEARDLNEAIDILNGIQKKLLGVVFNNVHTSAHGIRTSYDYGYDYGYGGNNGR